MKLSKIKAPDTFFLIFSLLFVTAILTWVIPGGEYNRISFQGKEIVDGNSFKFVESHPQGIADILMSPIKGFIDAALIIGFVLFVGGAFGVFKKTEAIDSAILAVTKAHKNSKVIRVLLIPIFMIMFSLAGAVFGMSEEVIPFILIFVPMSLMLGYDTITGVAIPFVAAGAGFAGAFLNPFTVGIAQSIAQLQLFSGLEYRILCWFVITFIAIFFVNRYAKKVKTNPELSITYKLDEEKRKKINFSEVEKHQGVSVNHKFVLLTFVVGFGILIFGVLEFQWYIEEIAALFIALTVIIGIVGRLSIKEITDSFILGAKELVGTALIIALARGILILSRDGKIIDTMLYTLSGPISSLHPIVSSQAMFLVQTIINFFVPSGSGQAVLTMPIMSPLSDIVGVSRQIAVLAFQFGDGFTNMIIPTSAVTMGVLTLAEVPWEKWAKWILPLEIAFFIIGLILLIPPFFLGWH